MIVILDANVLGVIANCGNKDSVLECQKWFDKMLARGARVLTSEICAYEVRRGLERVSLELGREVKGLKGLEDLRSRIDFLPVDKEVLVVAAQIWAKAAYNHTPMTDLTRLDADAIICAQWQILDEDNPGRVVIVATENLRDLQRFSNAEHWSKIIY